MKLKKNNKNRKKNINHTAPSSPLALVAGEEWNINHTAPSPPRSGGEGWGEEALNTSFPCPFLPPQQVRGWRKGYKENTIYTILGE
jgi:hypothetical protein